MLDHPIENPKVQAVFDGFPADLAPVMQSLRRMIFDVAAEIQGVGPISETLKWGQPAYLTSETGAGTTIRLGITKAGRAAIYVHCQTKVIAEFREIAPGGLEIEGTRAVHILDPGNPPMEALEVLIARALTYHLKKTA